MQGKDRAHKGPGARRKRLDHGQLSLAQARSKRMINVPREDSPVLEPGHVWLAGAGPGDPGLLTLDAYSGLLQADVIVHDALVDPRVLALAGAQAKLEFAGKRGGKPS